MNRLSTALAAASLALAGSLAFAQAPGGQGGPGMHGDRGQMREAFKAAQEACKDKPDRRACMTEQMCAKSQDPAKCKERAKMHGERMKQHVERSQKMHEACNGKRGADLTACMKSQRQAFMQQRMEERQKAHEACNGKRGDDLMKCLHEQRGAKPGWGRPGGMMKG